MKKYFLTPFIICLSFLNINNTDAKNLQPTLNVELTPIMLPEILDAYGPEITFEKTKHNFGSINQGEPVTYEFKFTNTGNSNLIIKNAVAGCGCTTPVWPKEPIAPGKTAVIKVGYDAKAEGNFVKDIKVQTNGGDAKLIITGIVELVASEPVKESIKLPSKN